ncbi:hypothetical protein ACRTEC_07105 [Janibacter indicus]
MTPRLVAVLLSALALGACGADGSAPPTSEDSTRTTQTTRTPMPDATTIKENLPAQVNGVRLIAYNIEADRAGLHLGPDRQTIRLDQTISVGGVDYTVAELVPTDPARGDHANGWVSLTQE